jgi:hypothetical protein
MSELLTAGTGARGPFGRCIARQVNTSTSASMMAGTTDQAISDARLGAANGCSGVGVGGARKAERRRATCATMQAATVTQNSTAGSGPLGRMRRSSSQTKNLNGKKLLKTHTTGEPGQP